MAKYYTTPEEHARAVIEAIEETHQKNLQSKEAALKLLKELGLIDEDKISSRVKFRTKKIK